MEVLARVDELLIEATTAVDDRVLRSPLSARNADVTALQRHVIGQAADRLRARMQEIMQRHALARPSTGRGAAQDCRAAVTQALSLVEGLGPRLIRCEEPVSDDQQAALHRIVAELFDGLDRMLDALGPGELPAATSAQLDEMRRIVADYGLQDLRPRLAELIDRMNTGDLRIAVLGRVNSGKSTLLNRLLGTDLLPTGPAPVTAVPVLLRHGPRPVGRVRFRDGREETLPPGRLAEFVAEHFNPGNESHVTQLTIDVPSQRLRGGLTFVDTPGLSADLALDPPQCDAGIVLIDATGGIPVAELELAGALLGQGAQVLILLSKADRLTYEERWQVYGHVTQRLLASFGNELPVQFASSVGDDAGLLHDWIVRGLDPIIARRQEVVEQSLRRKTAMVREAIIRALERRLAQLPGRAADREARDQLDQAQATVRGALGAAPPAHADAHRESERLLDEVAHNAAVLARHAEEDSLEVTLLARASLQARADAATKDMARELKALALLCERALNEVAGHCPPDAFRIDPAPAFEASGMMPAAVVKRPAMVGLGAWAVRSFLRRRLARLGVGARAASLLAAYFEQLGRWRVAALRQLDREVTMYSDRVTGEDARIRRDLDALPRL